MLSEIVATTIVFVSSANREIVKSALGFVKVAVVTLPVAIVRPHLSALVPALLGWSHDHKNHFKAKVRHIFERMLRRFGWDEVYSCAGEEEAAKVLVNIKKRKERAKRKKNSRAEDGEDDEEVSGQDFEQYSFTNDLIRHPILSPLMAMLSKMSCMEVKANWMTVKTKALPNPVDLLQREKTRSMARDCGWMTTSLWICCREQLLA